MTSQVPLSSFEKIQGQVDVAWYNFSLNTKIYSAEALKPEVFVVEEVTQAYSKAKTTREIARENLAAVEAKSGATKEEIQAAEAAVAEAKYAEIAAGQAFIENTGIGKMFNIHYFGLWSHGSNIFLRIPKNLVCLRRTR